MKIYIATVNAINHLVFPFWCLQQHLIHFIQLHHNSHNFLAEIRAFAYFIKAYFKLTVKIYFMNCIAVTLKL